MRQGEEHSNLEGEREAYRLIRRLMRNYALRHFERINVRTFTMLQGLGLFDGQADPIGANLDLAVLSDADHPRVESLPPGPLVVYSTAEGTPTLIVAELPALLCSELQHLRSIALARIEGMIASGALAATPKTLDILKKSRVALLSDASPGWRAAAVTATDALCNDVLITLQAVHQSLACTPMLRDILSIYVPRLINPTVSSLDSIDLPISDPEGEHAKLAEILRSIVAEAKSLGEVCERHFAILGYLPLAPRYSMGQVVSQWLETHPVADAWAEVWNWAEESSGPLPCYHATSVFIVRPDLVPDGKFAALWNGILSVVREVGDESDDWQELWLLRRDLVRHFTRYLEAQMPDSGGARIASLAWWLSEKVAALFPDMPETVRFYRENWVESAAERSGDVCFAASPRDGQSVLKQVTLGLGAPWAAGLLGLMAATLDQLAIGEQSEITREIFQESLVSQILTSFPFPMETPADPTFSFECAIGQTVLKWASMQAVEQRGALEQLADASRTLSSAEGLCKALHTLSDRSDADQVAVALAVKAKASKDASVSTSIWNIISDGEWRQRVLGAADERIIGLMVEALVMSKVESQPERLSLLPHYLAEVCEKAEGDERRRGLFFCVVHASLASDTVSGVRRLMRGSQKAKFVALAQEYREHVEGMWANYPPWVQGRIRALLASLHVV